MRKLVTTLTALLSALILAAAPASAAPPEQSEEPIFGLFPDLTNGLVVFWNITRDDYCAWEAGGFVGEPPVQELVPVTSHVTRMGAILLTWSADSTLELWTLDADADLSGPCQDTDDSTLPWAAGSAQARYTDNDLEVSLTRTNAFGDRAEGSVVDGDGASWHYSWAFRFTIDRNGEFVFHVDHTTLAPG
ncbi:MAG: hypothetical protein ACRDGJ_07020 [Candidatus Limnocylindria bacterium]